jgi:hypothetical protein
VITFLIHYHSGVFAIDTKRRSWTLFPVERNPMCPKAVAWLETCAFPALGFGFLKIGK